MLLGLCCLALHPCLAYGQINALKCRWLSFDNQPPIPNPCRCCLDPSFIYYLDSILSLAYVLIDYLCLDCLIIYYIFLIDWLSLIDCIWSRPVDCACLYLLTYLINALFLYRFLTLSLYYTKVEKRNCCRATRHHSRLTTDSPRSRVV